MAEEPISDVSGQKDREDPSAELELVTLPELIDLPIEEFKIEGEILITASSFSPGAFCVKNPFLSDRRS